MDKRKIIVALVLLPLFIWLIGWGPSWLLLVLVLAFAAGLGGWEAARLAFDETELSLRLLAVMLSLVNCLAASSGDEVNMMVALLGSFLVAFVVAAMFVGDLALTLPRTAKLMFVSIYPGLLSGYLVALKDYEALANGCKLVFVLFALVWINDSGAYFVGNLFGKHKMAPRISPNKTWEGAIGGFAAAVILGGVIGAVSPFFNLSQGLFLGFVLGIVGPVGDLLESAIKRGAGVKDSGTLLPGHGGILDRLDSVLVCAPILYYYSVFSNHLDIFQKLGVPWS